MDRGAPDASGRYRYARATGHTPSAAFDALITRNAHVVTSRYTRSSVRNGPSGLVHRTTRPHRTPVAVRTHACVEARPRRLLGTRPDQLPPPLHVGGVQRRLLGHLGLTRGRPVGEVDQPGAAGSRAAPTSSENAPSAAASW